MKIQLCDIYRTTAHVCHTSRYFITKCTHVCWYIYCSVGINLNTALQNAQEILTGDRARGVAKIVAILTASNIADPEATKATADALKAKEIKVKLHTTIIYPPPPLPSSSFFHWNDTLPSPPPPPPPENLLGMYLIGSLLIPRICPGNTFQNITNIFPRES